MVSACLVLQAPRYVTGSPTAVAEVGKEDFRLL